MKANNTPVRHFKLCIENICVALEKSLENSEKQPASPESTGSNEIAKSKSRNRDNLEIAESLNLITDSNQTVTTYNSLQKFNGEKNTSSKQVDWEWSPSKEITRTFI